MILNKETIKNLNLVYDQVYNLKGKHLNAVVEAQATLFLDVLEKDILNYGYEFKLNQKNQKFKLYKIKAK